MFDEGEVLAHLRQLRPHRISMVLEQGEALGLVSVARAHQFGVAPDAANRHPGRAQALQDLDPREVLVAVTTVAGPGPLDAVNQPCSFVVAQSVRAYARNPGGVSDCEPCLNGHVFEVRT